MKNTLTDKQYWNSNYQGRGSIEPVGLEGTRNRVNAQILEIKKRSGLIGSSVLEIGGGGSAWLAYLAREYPQIAFAALDYSEEGARLLEQFRSEAGLDNLRVFKRDFFSAQDVVGKFDFVYSHGVVEHFEDLAGALRAHASYLNDAGQMLTLIPNLAGILGPLHSWMNRSVYDIHVPHDLESLLEGHRQAGLEIIEANYLCSVNFGVLSSCVKEEAKFKFFVYRQLARLSTLVWMFESRVASLPVTRFFSPYIYAVSCKSRDHSDIASRR